MKKTLCILLCIVLTACIFAGCSGNNATNNEKLKIVTTIFPEYDWVRNILGDKAEDAELTMLLDNGVDLHSFQPTADDIIKISTCDVFIYVGGESDKWVDDALSESVNDKMTVINLMEVLGSSVKEEEIVEGMEAEEAGEEEEIEYDEHIWLSLKNAQLIVEEIAAKLGTADPANKQAYLDNAKAYNEKLATLDAKYQAAVDNSKVKTVLFGDRFPFRYMADDYGIKYYAAFAGCSAETEASFETVTFLASKVDELGLKAVFKIETGDGKIAETIISNTKNKDAKVLTMDSLQNTTSEDVNNGVTYYSAMESNLNVLTEALSA